MQTMKYGVQIIIVDSNGTSSEYPRCGFEEDGDKIGKLNIRKRALKMLGISGGSSGSSLLPNDRCKPNRWGEPMNS